jgi:DNA-3-methyladenine glycosylase I
MTQHRPARVYHSDSRWPHLKLGPQDDCRYFEQLTKAIFQAGLSWPAIESHWSGFSDVFQDFDPLKVAAMTDQDADQAAQNPNIICNHRKIKAAVVSAAAVNEVVRSYGSLDVYLQSLDSPEEELLDVQHHFPGLGDY